QHPAIAGQDLADPAAPDDGVAAAEEETVARFVRIVAPAAAVEHAEGQLVTAVVYVVENRSVALGPVLGGEKVYVRFEFNLAFRVTWGLVHIEDVLVARMFRIDGELGDTDQLLVRPDVAERKAVGERLAKVES